MGGLYNWNEFIPVIRILCIIYNNSILIGNMEDSLDRNINFIIDNASLECCDKDFSCWPETERMLLLWNLFLIFRRLWRNPRKKMKFYELILR